MQRGEKSLPETRRCPICGVAMTDSGKVSIETGVMNRFVTYYTFTCPSCGKVEFYDYATVNRKSQGQR